MWPHRIDYRNPWPWWSYEGISFLHSMELKSHRAPGHGTRAAGTSARGWEHVECRTVHVKYITAQLWEAQAPDWEKKQLTWLKRYQGNEFMAWGHSSDNAITGDAQPFSDSSCWLPQRVPHKGKERVRWGGRCWHPPPCLYPAEAFQISSQKALERKTCLSLPCQPALPVPLFGSASLHAVTGSTHQPFGILLLAIIHEVTGRGSGSSPIQFTSRNNQFYNKNCNLTGPGSQIRKHEMDKQVIDTNYFWKQKKKNFSPFSLHARMI